MSEIDDFYADDEPPYKSRTEIGSISVRNALCSLCLLGQDIYLGMQAFNIEIVDSFITDLEYDVLRKLIDKERTPVPEAAFLSAQSQMWIFGAYEILRTWRQRTYDMIKWHDNGGLGKKLEFLEKNIGYPHHGRMQRASQIRAVISDPSLIDRMRNEILSTHFLIGELKAIRVSLAKHEVAGSRFTALAPGYGRINRWCGSLDYELENGLSSMGTINRRDIADGIRALLEKKEPPTQEEIDQFDAYMRGPSREAHEAAMKAFREAKKSK